MRENNPSTDTVGNADTEKRNRSVLYGVEDVPAHHLTFLFGLQQTVMTIGSTISLPIVMTRLLCVEERKDVTSTLISITIFMCGVATFLQSTFGVRLGIIQGGSHTFLAPIVAMMAIDKWKCQEFEETGNWNGTEHDEDLWKERMRELEPIGKHLALKLHSYIKSESNIGEKRWRAERKCVSIQGNLIVASLTQLVLGCTGLLGFFLQFIGPLTIAPTISLIGLSLYGVALDFNKLHWGVAVFAMVLILLFSLYLDSVSVPMPAWTKSKKCHWIRFPLFQLFPVILAIGVSWILCVILTVTDTIPNNSTHPNYLARTDARLYVVDKAPWFYWPYPFQFGVPTMSAAGYVGFLAATLSSIIESIGDYYAAAKISDAPPPPAHAVNRGIAIEGFCSIISGLVGAGHGTTSYSSNIGAIGITKVASRRVFQVAGIMLVLCGVFGKFGAVLTLIPEPIIGGTLTVVFGLVAAVGLAPLQFLNINSTRNLTILGVSLLVGLMLPQYIKDPKNAEAIKTGNDVLDQVVQVMLGTAMFVGGLIGFLLDNTVPGTKEERGLLTWRENVITDTQVDNDMTIYEFPYITKYIRKVNWLSYVPISPTFDKEINLSIRCCKRRNNNGTLSDSVFTYSNDIALSEENSRL